MKSSYVNENNQDMVYPKLKMSKDGTIILFHDHGKGIIVSSNTCEIGVYSEAWKTEEFSDLKQGDKVVLEN